MLKSVQGKPVDGKTIRELRALVPGPLGSSVNLGFEGEQGPFDVDLERVQSARGQPTVYGGGGKGPAQRQAPPPPASTEGKAYVGFSVQQSGDPRDPDYTVANVTAESTADQQGLTQGDKIQAINNKDIRGMHEEEVKQMLIGEPFSTVKIVTASKTVEIERDCAVPEPEAGGPIRRVCVCVFIHGSVLLCMLQICGNICIHHGIMHLHAHIPPHVHTV